MHSFAKSSDGSGPLADLLDVRNTLYRTTSEGGSDYLGTVFSITTSGKERVLYAFPSLGSGANPVAGLVGVHGILYGTTAAGGAGNYGAIFSLTTTGKEKVVYSFSGGSDARDPQASLLPIGGVLYGTTVCGGAYGGGTCDLSSYRVGGTVFSVTPKGAERVIHSFGKGPDGASPRADLVALNGTLYGTTYYGGTGKCSGGCGVVFDVTTSGREKVIYSFAGGSDGALPLEA